jgi:hypothetical protein
LQLHHIQPPLAALALAHERLRLPQPLGDLLLAQARLLPQLAQQADEDPIVAREYGFLNVPSPQQGMIDCGTR